MKKFFTLAFLLLQLLIARAQYVDLPNTDFKTMLMQKYPGCFNGSGQLDTTCSAIRTEDSLEFHGLGKPTETAVDLEGIEYFRSLRYLKCTGNLITSSPALPASLLYLDYSSNAPDGPGGEILPVLPNTLRYLNIDSNYFNSVAFFPDSLRYLSCSGNSLTSLPPLPTKLDTFICIYESDPASTSPILNSLPALPITLVYLDCSHNALTSLPALPATVTYLNCSTQNYTSDVQATPGTLKNLPSLPASLVYLNCSADGLKNLPALPPALVYLACSNKMYDYSTGPPFGILDTGINVLPVLPSSLLYLFFGPNNLAALPNLPPAISRVNCSDNHLTSLPALPASLKQIDFSQNSITSLPQLPDSLIDVNLRQNLLTSLPANLPGVLAYLDVSLNYINCLPHLPPSMGGQSPYHLPNDQNPNNINLYFDQDKILCLPNSVTGLRPEYTLPLCTPVNNANGCSVYPVVSGTTYYDNNSNGAKDAGEEYRPNVKVQLSNGMTGYSDINGHYELSADLGTYTLTVAPPPYYNAVPATVNHTFTTYDTLATDLISLQPNTSIDSVSISMIPYFAARPGFNYSYTINYENTGTTTVSPAIHINYDALRLAYENSTNPSVTNSGGVLSVIIPSLTPGQTGSFIVNFTVNTSAAMGDTLFGKATLTAGAKTSVDSVFTVIRGAYDPNEKLATPSVTPLQVAAGDYVNYLVTFQNTGTDTAFTVVVTDTLSSLLQAGSLQMIGSSHPCRITQEGNVIIFEFLNILLPDSNTNSAASHGYVKFRIRPGTSLSNSVANTANIYFDYNSPVNTNAALTTVTQVTLPLGLLSFKALSQQDGTAVLYWSTTNEEGTRSFAIEQSLDATVFKPVATITAHGAGSNSYMQQVNAGSGATYYRLKITNADGSYKYSGVIKITGLQSGGFVITNPARGKLYVTISDASLNGTRASIINSNGAIVKTALLQTGFQNIDVSNLAAGNYFIKTISGNKKFIIIK